MHLRRFACAAFDLDGTLLDAHSQLSPRTKAVMAQLAQAGIPVVVASGRPFSTIPREVLALDAVRYVITGNGVRIYDKTTGKMKADIIILEGETIDPSKDLRLSSDKTPWRSRIIPAGSFTVRTMLQPVFVKGELVYTPPTLKDIMAYADQEIDTLWPEYKRLVNPETMWVQRSTRLSELRHQILTEEAAHFQ